MPTGGCEPFICKARLGGECRVVAANRPLKALTTLKAEEQPVEGLFRSNNYALARMMSWFVFEVPEVSLTSWFVLSA